MARDTEGPDVSVMLDAVNQADKNRRYIHLPQTSLDGNFQNNQKHKKFDPLDAPLTMGAAYYAHEGAFAKYQSQQFTSDAQEVCG